MSLHESLKNRALINIYLKPLSPLHTGCGDEGDALKRILRFTVNGKLVPLIPAESIKGVMRAEASRLAKSLSFNEKNVTEVVACHKKDKHTEDEENRRILEKYAAEGTRLLTQFFNKEQVAQIEMEEKIGLKNLLLEIYASYYCPICRLFG